MTREMFDDVDAAVRSANPMPDHRVAAFDPATVDAVTREIAATATRRTGGWRPWSWVPLGGGGAPTPPWGRVAFVGALGLVAIIVVGAVAVLGGVGPDDGADDVADRAPATIAPTTAPAATSSVPDSTAIAPTTSVAPAPTDTTVPSNGVATTAASATPGSLTAGGCISIEAETLATATGWTAVTEPAASGGASLRWTGAPPTDGAVDPSSTASVSIPVDDAGAYRLSWSSRVPSETGEELQPGSRLAVEGATRFGPISDGSYPGFVDIVGAGFGGFGWAATASVDGVMSDPVIEMAEPGLVIVQIAPGFTGHEIDRIVIYHDSMDLSAALAGPCR